MKRFILAGVLILIAVAAHLLWPRTAGDRAIFRSDRFGLVLSYPRAYFLEEKDLGDAQRYHHEIVLTEDTQENRRVREGQAPAREGPVAITVDIYQNAPERQSPDEWIRTSPESNFHFSNRRLTPYPIGGTEGLLYMWSGLYEADAVAVAASDDLYVFTVTYIAPEDRIRRDFYDMIRTVRFR